MMKRLAVLGMLLTGCSSLPDGVDWTESELEVIESAAEEIEDVFGVPAPVDSLRRVTGVYPWVGTDSRLYGLASPKTGLAVIYVDEVAAEGGEDLLRTTVMHELLHVMGCWAHLEGGTDAVMAEWGDWGGGLTVADWELCRGVVQ